MSIDNQTSDTTKLAAQMAPEFRMQTADASISGISGGHVREADLFNAALDSANRLMPAVAQAVLGIAGVGIATGSGTAAGFTGVALAFNAITKGSSTGPKGGRSQG